jgi:hypothetical protein
MLIWDPFAPFQKEFSFFSDVWKDLLLLFEKFICTLMNWPVSSLRINNYFD